MVLNQAASTVTRSTSSVVTPSLQVPEQRRELVRLFDERLAAVETYGGTCQVCRDAEAHAFLVRLRTLLPAGLEEASATPPGSR